MKAYTDLKDLVEKAKADIFGEIDEILAECDEDAVKFYEKENKSAGTRIRSAMQKVRKAVQPKVIREAMNEVKNQAQNVRVDVQEKRTTPAS